MYPVHRRWTSSATRCAAVLAGLAISIASLAQPPDIQFGAVYECPAGTGFKVFACAGTRDADPCEVQSYANGQPRERGQAPRQQVMLLIPVCRVQAAAGTRPGAGNSPSQPPPSAQAGVGGFKPGDTVRILTAGGWYEAKVVQVRGNTYRVQLGGTEVWKSYPDELRRIGPLTAEDRSYGLFDLRDKVQVNFEGRWIDSVIIGEMGKEYNVTLPGNRTGWTTAENLRLIAQPVKSPPKAGVPPQAESPAAQAKSRDGTPAEDKR